MKDEFFIKYLNVWLDFLDSPKYSVSLSGNTMSEESHPSWIVLRTTGEDIRKVK